MGERARLKREPRRRMRWVLRIHAALWALFALGLAGLAVASVETRQDPVFLQVLAGSLAAAIGATGAALYRRWGVWLALLGGGSVLLAWILGDSGDPWRWYVLAALAVFALSAMIDRDAFGISGASR